MFTRAISRVDYNPESVSTVVSEALSTGSKRQRMAVMVAASFGVSQFDIPTIVHASHVLEECDDSHSSPSAYGSDEDDDPGVVEMRVSAMHEQLQGALSEGFIQRAAKGESFRFTHDRIRCVS